MTIMLTPILAAFHSLEPQDIITEPIQQAMLSLPPLVAMKLLQAHMHKNALKQRQLDSLLLSITMDGRIRIPMKILANIRKQMCSLVRLALGS